MVLTISRLILVHDHVEHPVELVLDAPMAADDGVETFRREGLAEQIAAGLDRRSAVDLAGSGDLSDRLQARPIVALVQPCDIGRERCRTGFDAAVPLVRLAGGGKRGLGIIEKRRTSSCSISWLPLRAST